MVLALRYLLVICVIHVAPARGLPCDFTDSVNITDGYTDEKGNIIHENVKYPPDYFSEVNYTIEGGRKIFIETYRRGCLCTLKVCVRLCVKGKTFSKGSFIDTNATLTVNLNTSAFNNENKLEIVDLAQNEAYAYVYGKPCEFMYFYEPEIHPDEEWYFLKNGSINAPQITTQFDRNGFCLMNLESPELAIAAVCFTDDTEIKYALYPYGMLLSVPFLLATLFVYACIPDLRNIHGKSLMCYVLGLSVGYTLLSIIQWQIFGEHTSAVCTAFGYVTYFSFMLSFFWLNVMCFDIWWTFRGVRGVRSTEKKKYIFYSLYAWGCPIAILGLVLFMDFSGVVPEYLRPRFGVDGCFLLKERMVEFVFLYLPILILIFINVTFFVITTLRILKIQRETSVIRKGDSKRHSKLDNDRDRFGLYLRLFIVMGVTWSLEFISWAVNNQYYIFYLSDICNCIQGFLIFMLFVWKQKVKRLLWKKFGIQQLAREQTTSSCSRTTTTSYVPPKSESPLVRSITVSVHD